MALKRAKFTRFNQVDLHVLNYGHGDDLINRNILVDSPCSHKNFNTARRRQGRGDPNICGSNHKQSRDWDHSHRDRPHTGLTSYRY